MFCRNCQTVIPDDSIFCENCGAPTGLNPEQAEDPGRIDGENLVPDEAVDFEVVEEIKEPVVSDEPDVQEEPLLEIVEEPDVDEETEGSDLFEYGEGDEDIDEGTEEDIDEENGPAGLFSVPVDPVWWEPPGDKASREADQADQSGQAEANDGKESSAGEDRRFRFIPGAGSSEEGGDAGSGIHINTEELKQKLAEAAEQAKPYVNKAKTALENLGRSARTGTGWAAVAARERLRQLKESYEERKEQREQQREQDRQRKEEEEQLERERQAELAAQEEERRREEAEKERERREAEERERQETLLQRPGFWYGSELSKTEGGPESGAGEKIESETEAEAGGELKAESEAGQEAGGEPESQAEAAREPESQEEPEAESQPEPEVEPQPVFMPGPGSGKEPEVQAEIPLEEDIEDKLADTARYDWSAGDLEDLDKESSEGADDEGKAGEEEIPPDEPALYRIKDFGRKDKAERRPIQINLKMVVIIAVIVLAIASVAAVLLHQAHQRELEEQAYQASVKKAEMLAENHKYKKAEKQYLKLMGERPEDTNLYLGLAQMYIDQQRYVDAKALIKRAVKATGDEKAFAEMKAELKILTSKKWKKEYAKILEDNEEDIRQYEEDVQASVAVCDVNDDMKPELFFFTKEYYGYGKLHIYTTVDNKAKEVNYECKNRGTQYQDAFYDISPDDCSYAILNSKETGRFSIYANIIHDGASWDTTNEYELNLKGGCKQVNVIEGSIVATYDDDEDEKTKYLLNDEEISYDKYIAEFNRVLGDSREVILYNGSAGDQAVWTKIKPDNVMCMSYDAMMVDLTAD